MTIGGWIVYGILALVVIAIAGLICYALGTSTTDDMPKKKRNFFLAITVVVAIAILIGMYSGMHWYYTSTASGQRDLTDERSELSGGLERTITVYTADGKIIAQYTGKIDIEGNDGGYVLFDYNGKRYTYYNCFVESIAEIG